ncbi:MAG: hypothetical protein ABSH50_01890 [Bryobacteraceae bacterium]|jgi:hypothetical protein
MRVLTVIQAAKAVAIGSAASLSLMTAAFAQSEAVQGTPSTAIGKNLGGMTQGIALFFPGGHPIATLHAIDGKGPMDFGKGGKTFGSKFEVAISAGQHSLTVSFSRANYDGSFSKLGPLDVSFVAQSARTYVVECSLETGRWIPLVVDRADKSDPQMASPLAETHHAASDGDMEKAIPKTLRSHLWKRRPPSARLGAVKILGTDLTGATGVSFNGTAACLPSSRLAPAGTLAARSPATSPFGCRNGSALFGGH